MPIAVSVQIPVLTKDPREAMDTFIELLLRNATNIDSLQIDLSLICGARNGILFQLANRLLPSALGFRTMSSDRDQTASEFIQQRFSGFSTFMGTLTDHVSGTQALDLLDDLLKRPPAEIRSTAFSPTAKNVHWKGSPSGSSGFVSLFDFKSFKRAQRFSLSAGLSLPGEDPQSAEVKAAIGRVSKATGISFHGDIPSRVLAANERHSQEYGRTALVGQIAFDEAVECVINTIPSQLIPQLAPSAFPHGKAFQTRMEQLGSESSERVDLAQLLKRAIRDIIPELKLESVESEMIVFQKRFGSNEEILVTYFRNNPRLGKSFTINLSIRHPEKLLFFETNLFRLIRTTEERSWIYANRKEAENVVMESILLLKEILPEFEAGLRSYFSSWPADLPQNISHRGPLTAREAFAPAYQLAREQFSDAKLIRIFGQCRSLATRDIEGAELSFDGRLTMNGAWWFHFYSHSRDTSFEVTVPFVGCMRRADHGEQYRNVNSRNILTPIDDEWIDSDRVFAIAEEQGGRERRSIGKTFGIATKLQMSRSLQPYWAVMYLVVDKRGRNDLIINIDAHSGEILHNIEGY